MTVRSKYEAAKHNLKVVEVKNHFKKHQEAYVVGGILTGMGIIFHVLRDGSAPINSGILGTGKRVVIINTSQDTFIENAYLGAQD